MNDNDRFKAVRGQEALNARPPNGARVEPHPEDGARSAASRDGRVSAQLALR